ncbi:MAG: hypothetical protein EB107_09585 [Proteobacteria bacterium]|nr:hypothetical protein [Pseudomonadota bacterium]
MIEVRGGRPALSPGSNAPGGCNRIFLVRSCFYGHFGWRDEQCRLFGSRSRDSSPRTGANDGIAKCRRVRRRSQEVIAPLRLVEA